MIFMPPRHGKSELVTVRYAGWRLWNDPKMKVIVSSYNQKLADQFSRSIRRLLSEEEDKRAATDKSVPPALAGGFLRPRGEKNPPANAGGSDSAMPLDVRKGCAFPEAALDEKGGSASDDGFIRQVLSIPSVSAAAQPLVKIITPTERLSLSAHRAAEPRGGCFRARAPLTPRHSGKRRSAAG
jgi:hypothetical protein